ncbi:phage-related protein [Kribbella sp. VKM Ac-2527]|uniref:Phage-related protein n=1 Tax=Kribbella caucasensis TaxID=2512215 RepID=A0A4R6KBM2_9ACTN|nr:hypothetical protein [Kribbella sp. VKM Ac-2527]TDO47271.1 phage-related protein [Kribbella sp. VKM Ac-2527]
MVGSHRTSDSAAKAEAGNALAEGKRRAAGQRARPFGGLLGLQRAAGNAAVNALLAAKLKSPGDQAISEIDSALREIKQDEPAIDTVEKGLKQAKAAGVPVDLEGPKPPPSALAVTTTGFGPSAVPAKKPVPPPKPVPKKSPLGKAASKAPKVGGSGGGGGAAGPVAAGGAGAAAPEIAPLAGEQLLQPPVRPTGVRPEEDPAFTQVTSGVKGFAKAKRAHPPAASKAKEAQDAALAPTDDLTGQAKAAKADTMDAQQPGTFDKKAFIAAVKTAIEAKSPKTLKEADNYKESGKAAEVKGDVKGMVTQGKEGQAKDIEAATEAPPDQSKAVPKPVTPMETEDPGQTAAVPAAGAVPKTAPPEQTNLEAGKHQANSEMAEAEVSEQQLAQSNEPQFQDALKDKQAAAAHADTAPAAFRQQEQQTIAQNKAEATAETKAGVAGMQGSKAAALAKLVAEKGKTKSKDEAKRAEVTAKIQGIFTAAETDVKKILDGIDPKVEAAFDEGEKSARAAFEGYVAGKMSAYKKDRYGGWLGGLRWAKDKLLGMPSKVNEFYEAGREIYLKQMDGVISKVADIVGNDLTAAKARIASGRSEIAAYVKSLPADLQKVGGEAAKEIGEKFEQLESDVDSKQDALVETLASKYTEARKGLDERIEELQAENKGLVDKAIGAIKAVINTIRELVGMLKNVLARVAGVVGDIVKNPVGFLSNLIDGVKGGILKFKDNILDHLRKGLMSWLFGALAEGGVQLPDKFDIKGILQLLLSLFGLTWANIRNRLVKNIGEPAMAAMEKGVEIFQKLRSEGIAGLWQMLIEKLGDIKEMILEQVKDFVITKIITAGITWLIGLLNPAAAFIKACKLIYDVVMFFVNNGSRILKFVNTVIDSVADIVKGNVGGVVNKINDVLGQMVPIIIGFLASVIGLGGIGQKIREIVEKLQKPVNKALDFVIKTGLKLAGPVIRGLKKIGGKVKAKIAAGKAYVKGKVEAGKAYVKGKVEAGKGWVKKKAAGVTDAFRRLKDRMLGITFRESFEAGGEKHEIYSKKGAPQNIYTASKNPKPAGKAVSDPAVAQLDDEFRANMTEYYRLASTMTGTSSDRALMAEANKLWRQAKAILKKIVALTKKEMDATGGGPGGHAPHIGEAAPHHMQQSRLRPPDKGKEVSAWRMESEHLIPRELISAFFSILPINAPVSNAEYDAMVTVLMYANASKEKTTTAAVGDLASIRRMKQLVREKMKALPANGRFPPDLLERIRDDIQKEFRARGRDSVSRAAAAVVAEQKTVGDARGKGAETRPSRGEIVAAYEAQLEQVLDFLEERVKGVERFRAEGKQ